MKKIGLIGGTGPESTIIYYKEICNRVYQDTGFLPPLVIDSLSVYQVLSFSKNNEFDKLVEYLNIGLSNLKNGGAEFAAFTGITPHVVFDKLQSKSELPIISIPNTLFDYAKEKNLKD